MAWEPLSHAPPLAVLNKYTPPPLPATHSCVGWAGRYARARGRPPGLGSSMGWLWKKAPLARRVERDTPRVYSASHTNSLSPWAVLEELATAKARRSPGTGAVMAAGGEAEAAALSVSAELAGSACAHRAGVLLPGAEAHTL